MTKLTIKFYLILILFIFLFITAFFTKDAIQTNLLASIAFLLFVIGIRNFSRQADKKRIKCLKEDGLSLPQNMEKKKFLHPY
jgi:1,4-dihydroxy-2-naphthoate octaprenyltransferase